MVDSINEQLMNEGSDFLKLDLEDKYILDVTCSGRSMWFDKNHKNAVYTDIRELEKGSHLMSPNFCVKPDLIADFRNLPFEDGSFKLVVFDPPHLKGLDLNSWIGSKYGLLNPETWKEDIRKGIYECMRVLDDYGVLVFKWSKSSSGHRSRDISIATVLETIKPLRPVFGHPSGSKLNTLWMVFIKHPSPAGEKQAVITEEVSQ